MSHPPTSRNLRERLSEQRPIRAGADSMYVQHVRAYVAECRNSGSQQHRLRHLDENWLISQFRWITEQRAAGGEWSKIRRVLEACLHEVDVEIEKEAIVGHIGTDVLIAAAKQETATGFYQDSATLDAVQHQTPGTLRRFADMCMAQVDALKQAAHIARTMAAKMTTRSA